MDYERLTWPLRFVNMRDLEVIALLRLVQATARQIGEKPELIRAYIETKAQDTPPQ